jgi:hypothetical protein
MVCAALHVGLYLLIKSGFPKARAATSLSEPAILVQGGGCVEVRSALSWDLVGPREVAAPYLGVF